MGFKWAKNHKCRIPVRASLNRGLVYFAAVLIFVTSTISANLASSSQQQPPDTSGQTPQGQSKPTLGPSISTEPESGSTSAEDQVSPSSLNLHQWGSVTLFHGLPSDHVRVITQDQEGVLWFGTDSGLARYDGRRIQKMNPDGMPSSKITSLLPNADGAIWVGTDAGAGLLTGTRFNAIPDTSGKAITSITQLPNGDLALTSLQGAVYLCKPVAGGVGSVRGLTGNSSRLLLLDPQKDVPLGLTSAAPSGDRVLIGTEGRGLLEFENGDVKEVLTHPRSFFINAVASDKSGRIWLGAATSPEDGGLFVGNGLAKLEKLNSVTGSVTSLVFDRNGNLWVGTEKHGAFFIKDQQESQHFTFENTAGGLRSDLVYSTFVDREGVIWFGTDRGVCRYDPGSPRAERVSNDPESNFIRSLYKSPDGLLWCGTNRGLFYRNEKLFGWNPVEQLAGKAVYSITQSPSGEILAGSIGGLFRGSKRDNGWVFSRIENSDNSVVDNIRSVAVFNGAIYAASFGRGIEQVNGSTLTQLWPSDPKNGSGRDTVALYSEGNSRLWVGTALSGVYFYDGRQVLQDPALASLAGAAVWSICGNEKEGLWIGTARGLLYYRNGQLKKLLEGVDARFVTAGATPDKAWCATAGDGLYEFNLSGGDAPEFSRLDSERGLPSDHTFAVLAANGENGAQSVWVGTNRGLASYSASAVPPVLRVIRLLGRRSYQPDEIKRGLRLEYPQNSLLLELEGMSSRTFPEQFKYAFTLIDSQGNVIKQRTSQDPQFVADNLRPGKYSIKAIVYSEDLVPSEALAFGFAVAGAPFPRTSAALAVLLLLALLVLFWGYNQNRRIVLANVKLEETNQLLAQTRLQLANETENERRRIARDLHDQTLSDLRRLLLMTDDLSGSNGNTEAAAFRKEIESVSTEIRHICEDLSPSVLSNVGLIAALEWALADAVAHLPAGNKFEFEFTSPDDTEDRLHLDGSQRIHIYRIVQEAINNTCRHAGAMRVRLDASIDDDGSLVVTLEDDGCGIDVTNKNRRFGRGLNNITSRASLIDAEVSWTARPDGGTIFRLRKAKAATAESPGS